MNLVAFHTARSGDAMNIYIYIYMVVLQVWRGDVVSVHIASSGNVVYIYSSGLRLEGGMLSGFILPVV